MLSKKVKGDANRVYVLLKDWSQAVGMASRRLEQGLNGAYQECDDGFLVSWDIRPLAEVEGR